MTKKDYQWVYGALGLTVVVIVFMLYEMSNYSPLYHPIDNQFNNEATQEGILKFN